MTTTTYNNTKLDNLAIASKQTSSEEYITEIVGFEILPSGSVYIGISKSGKEPLGIMLPIDNVIVALRDARIISATEGITSEMEQ